MATSHVSLSTVASGTRTNTTITAPASIANDDILRIYFSIGAEPGPVPTPTPPTGFSQLLFSSQSGLGGGGAGVLDLYVWEKRAASESGNYTITHNSTFTSAYMEVVRGGVTSGSAEDFAATINQQQDNSTYTATGGTTTVNDSFVTFVFIAWEDASPVTPPTGTTPTFTERYDPASGEIYAANGVLATAGATGNKSATGNTQATFGGSNTTLTSVKAAVAGGSAISSDGTGAMTMSGASVAEGAFSISGTGSMTMAGAALADAAVSSDGTSTVEFGGVSAFPAAFSMDGSATAEFAGASEAASAASMDGSSTVEWTGASTADAAASIDGSATVEWVGQSTASGEMSADGSSTVEWVGSSLADGAGDFEMAGEGTMTMEGASLADGALGSDGEGAASFESLVEEAPVEEEPEPTPRSGGEEPLGGAWPRRSSLRRKRLKEEDEDILQVLRALAPQIMRHRRTLH